VQVELATPQTNHLPVVTAHRLFLIKDLMVALVHQPRHHHHALVAVAVLVLSGQMVLVLAMAAQVKPQPLQARL